MIEYESLADEQLVELCRKDNHLAWVALCEKYTPVARKKVSILGSNVADAEDLIQEGLIGLFSAVYSFDRKKNASFSTYANVCIRNSILNAANSIKAKSGSLFTPIETEAQSDYIDTSMTPEEVAVSKNEVEFLQGVIVNTLSKKERDVFLLFLSGHSYAEIAKKLSTTEKSVDGALQRARSKLKSVLSR